MMNALPACSDASSAERHKQTQRDRILSAAMQCFVSHGFHNASMATIAETAGMSPGLIYRYFANKNAIIFAIIESQLDVARQRVCDMRNADDLCATMLGFFRSQDGACPNSMSVPLFLEMSAEATRDPEIAAAVREIDGRMRRSLADWFARSPDQGGLGLKPEAAEARALAFILLIDGLKARKAREPGLDLAVLRNAVDTIVGAVVGD